MFSCASCGNCVEHCAFPKFKDQLLLAITAGKEELVNEALVPPAVRDCLTSLQLHGNPYGKSGKLRGRWAEDLDIEAYKDQEYLFHVGDVGSYDTRGQEIAASVTSLLTRLGISFGILGSNEKSAGNEARAMGEIELFKYLAEANINMFEESGIRKIIALSPHAYSAFRKDYPLLGGRFQVFHYTQVIQPQMPSLTFSSGKNLKITFHDPCYLGRHNMEYIAARKILAAIPGVELVEMDRCLQNSLCCGGGGGNLYTDLLGGGTDAPSRSRVREACETGAEILAVACPACAVMLEDAVKAEKLDGLLAVREISEIVQERLA